MSRVVLIRTLLGAVSGLLVGVLLVLVRPDPSFEKHWFSLVAMTLGLSVAAAVSAAYQVNSIAVALACASGYVTGASLGKVLIGEHTYIVEVPAEQRAVQILVPGKAPRKLMDLPATETRIVPFGSRIGMLCGMVVFTVAAGWVLHRARQSGRGDDLGPESSTQVAD